MNYSIRKQSQARVDYRIKDVLHLETKCKVRTEKSELKKEDSWRKYPVGTGSSCSPQLYL